MRDLWEALYDLLAALPLSRSPLLRLLQIGCIILGLVFFLAYLMDYLRRPG
jgi:hypothetical protein